MGVLAGIVEDVYRQPKQSPLSGILMDIESEQGPYEPPKKGFWESNRDGWRLGFMTVAKTADAMFSNELGNLLADVVKDMAIEDQPQLKEKFEQMEKTNGFWQLKAQQQRGHEEYAKQIDDLIDRHPEWQNDAAKNTWDLLTSPTKLSASIAQSMPTMIAAGLVMASGNPVGSMAVMFEVEGQEAYDNAIRDGATPEQARKSKIIYGSVASVIEFMQLDLGWKLGKGAYGKVLKKGVQGATELAAEKGTKSLTKRAILGILTEGGEEALQGTWQEMTAKMVYGKPLLSEGGIKGFADRRGQEFVTGGVMGGLGIVGGGGAGGIANMAKQKDFKGFFLTPEGAEYAKTRYPDWADKIKEKDDPSRSDFEEVGIKGWNKADRKKFADMLRKEPVVSEEEVSDAEMQPETPEISPEPLIEDETPEEPTIEPQGEEKTSEGLQDEISKIEDKVLIESGGEVLTMMQRDATDAGLTDEEYLEMLQSTEESDKTVTEDTDTFSQDEIDKLVGMGWKKIDIINADVEDTRAEVLSEQPEVDVPEKTAETIDMAATRLKSTGEVFTAGKEALHDKTTTAAIKGKFGENVPKEIEDYTDFEDGFVTSDGRFVGREEAAKIAKSKRKELDAKDIAPKTKAQIGAEKGAATKKAKAERIEGDTGVSTKHRVTLIKETKKRITESEMYQFIDEGDRHRATLITDQTYYIGKDLLGNLTDITGKSGQKGFDKALYNRFTTDKSKGQPWDEAVQEMQYIKDPDAPGMMEHMDISDFIAEVEHAIEVTKMGSFNRSALETEAENDPYAMMELTKLEMLEDGGSIDEINEAVDVIANDFKTTPSYLLTEAEHEVHRVEEVSGQDGKAAKKSSKKEGGKEKVERDKDMLGREELVGGTTGKQKDMLDKDKFKTHEAAEKDLQKDDAMGQKDFFGGEKKPEPKQHKVDKSKPKAADTKDMFEDDTTGTIFDKKDEKKKPPKGPKAPGGQGMAAFPSEEEDAEPLGKRGTKKREAFEKEIGDKGTINIVDDFFKLMAPSKRNALAKGGGQLIRARNAEMAHEIEVARKKLEKWSKVFNRMPRQEELEFIYRMEEGTAQPTKALQTASDVLRELYDGRLRKLQDTGVLLGEIYENYFAHQWKHKERATSVAGEILRKKPLEGTKSFMRQRVHQTTRAGIEAGLVPVTYNPAIITLNKLIEIDQYLMAQYIFQDLDTKGWRYFKYATSRMPEGAKIINDKLFQVKMPPKITIGEAYDKLQFENLMLFAKSIGISVETLTKMGGNTWGKAYGKDKVQRRFAGPESVLAHEIGHALGNRYNLHDNIRQAMVGEDKVITRGKNKGKTRFVPSKDAVALRRKIEPELRALADLRMELQEDVTPSYKKYLRKAAEKEAVLLEAYIHAPARMKEIAPTVFAAFEKFLSDHAELRPLMDIGPSLVLGSAERDVELSGITHLGDYVVPAPIADLINNLLSKGIRSSDNKTLAGGYDALRKIGNLMNQASLGLSLFHGFNTTTDVMASHVGLGLRQLFTKGQFLQGVGNIVISPISPLPNLWRGMQMHKAWEKDLAEIDNPEMRTMIENVISAGGRAKMDVYYFNDAIHGLSTTLEQIVHGSAKEKVKGGMKLPFNVVGSMLEVSAKPIMEYLVPRQKLGLFSKLAQHEMQRHRDGQITDDQLLQRMTEAWDNVDNRMGQLVYDNLFWNKTLKDSLMLAVRSVGWNLGSWREYAGSGVDIFTTKSRLRDGDVIISQKMGYTAGAVFTYTILGAVMMYLYGTWPPEEPKDYFFPKTGKKNPDGSDERTSLPTYAKDWFAYKNDPVATVQHKLHPIWNAAISMFKNEDFYGTEIRHPGDPLVSQTEDMAKYFGTQFIPFSVRNTQRMIETGHTKGKALATSITGITKAPASVTRTTAHKLMIRRLVSYIPKGTRTKEEFERSRARKRIIQALRDQGPIKDSDLALFNMRSRKAIGKEAKLTAQQAAFGRLHLTHALDVYAVTNKAERKEFRPVLVKKWKNSRTKTPEMLELYKELLKL